MYSGLDKKRFSQPGEQRHLPANQTYCGVMSVKAHVGTRIVTGDSCRCGVAEPGAQAAVCTGDGLRHGGSLCFNSHWNQGFSH